MKNVNVLLAVVLCAGLCVLFGLFNRSADESLGWSPNDMYMQSILSSDGSSFTSANLSDGNVSNDGVAVSMRNGSFSLRTRARHVSSPNNLIANGVPEKSADFRGALEVVENKVVDVVDYNGPAVENPIVYIPVFPGTNCDYDSAKAWRKAGAEVETTIFRNLTGEDVLSSIDEMVEHINRCHILMFAGGFSAGDEPDGSGKFIASVINNQKVGAAITALIDRGGLILGICNGFQALIKLGLLPCGEILPQTENSPTLTMNTIGRHQSKMAYTKVVSNLSPWMSKANLGGVYTVPISHGEGRFVAPKEWLDKLFQNGQVATQYVDLDGNPTMNDTYNMNGSYMAIEGITSADGRILGKMAHSERIGNAVAINIYGDQNQLIFESGVEYFK